ncbi:methylated-DNA--[protein]-cysteine S-methyltransferase [Taklimakanibacter lacteus]|uniref:methylated-DNA--[protein]-cysteine S-methyltransferase n=1 Tax=Taklimakanibacter lacteus TaxID=2268456 RepID=UPI000E6628EE
MSTILTDHIETPIGPMLLMVEDDVMIGLEFDDQPERYMKDLRRRYPELAMKEIANPCGFSDHLRAYYQGDLGAVDGLPTKGGGTPFQERVWAELRRIPASTTISYGELAGRLGDENAMRAVGLANGRNPISVVVPCHRVIGSDGTLTGYGGGLPRKTWLLNHEGVPIRNGRVDRQADLFEA